MPLYNDPSAPYRSLLLGGAQSDPAMDAASMASPIGMAAVPAKGIVQSLLGRWMKKSPATSIGAPSMERAMDPLFTANEMAGMKEIERVYQNYMGHPIRLGVTESRQGGPNALTRSLLDRMQGGMDPDTFQHARNAFLAGMEHAKKLAGVK